MHVRYQSGTLAFPLSLGRRPTHDSMVFILTGETSGGRQASSTSSSGSCPTTPPAASMFCNGQGCAGQEKPVHARNQVSTECLFATSVRDLVAVAPTIVTRTLRWRTSAGAEVCLVICRHRCELPSLRAESDDDHR